MNRNDTHPGYDEAQMRFISFEAHWLVSEAQVRFSYEPVRFINRTSQRFQWASADVVATIVVAI